MVSTNYYELQENIITKQFYQHLEYCALGMFFWVDKTLIFCLLQEMKNVENDLK